MRSLWASTVVQGYLEWPGVAQMGKLERRTERKGKLGDEVRYAITSLGGEVGPGQWLKPVHGHWGIEHRLHRVRDATLGEDATPVQTGAAAQVMAALRNLVIGLLRQANWANIAASLRHDGWQPGAALQLLGISPPG